MIPGVSVGDAFTRELKITDELMSGFKALSGDDHPLHNSREYAVGKGFRERVAYGNIIGFMISSLVGVEMRRIDCMLVSQSIVYRKPVFLGDAITLKGTVENILEAIPVMDMKFEVRNQDNQLVATGKIQVKKL